MEYLVFWGLVIVFLILAISRQIVSDKRKKRDFEETLRRDYGHLRERKYNADRFERMDRYFRKHQEPDQIDDITWNDLGMDEIFINMNHTYSAVGEEYLYYLLRSTGHDREQIDHFEKLIAFFSGNEDQRVFLQLWMAKLGYMGNYSLYDYLDHLDYLGERSNRKAYFCNALFLLLVVLLPFWMPAALCGIVGLVVYNILTYFKEKSEIEPYVISFVYIQKLMNICKELEKLPGEKHPEELRDEIRVMTENRKRLLAVSSGSGILLSGGGVIGGNPLEIVMDYIRMAFHVDLIQFNRMLSTLRKNTDAVDALATVAGRLEAAVAVGAWRKGLQNGNGYCIPKLREMQKPLSLKLVNAYHPLLTKPVKNTIDAKSGVLLTGSNASGKSTFLKTCAINAILAQTVHTCTADQYEAPMFRIYSSMALRDDLEGGDSYYIVEIKALKRILTAAKEMGRPVLCFVDEVLRGTNTVERIAASTQILKSLHEDGMLCFAATHDIELTDLLSGLYENYHFEEEIRDGDIYFQYRLLEGKATSRNAIRLLEILGYDKEIIDSAERMAGDFLVNGTWT